MPRRCRLAGRRRVTALPVAGVVDHGAFGRHGAGLLVVLRDEPRRVRERLEQRDAAVLVGVGLGAPSARG